MDSSRESVYEGFGFTYS